MKLYAFKCWPLHEIVMRNSIYSNSFVCMALICLVLKSRDGETLYTKNLIAEFPPLAFLRLLPLRVCAWGLCHYNDGHRPSVLMDLYFNSNDVSLMLPHDREKMLLSCISLSCMLLSTLFRTLHGLLVPCEWNFLSLCNSTMKLAVWFVIGVLIVLFLSKQLVPSHYWCRYLKSIDRFNDLVVSVYVTAGHILWIIHIWYFCHKNELLDAELWGSSYVFSMVVICACQHLFPNPLTESKIKMEESRAQDPSI